METFHTNLFIGGPSDGLIQDKKGRDTVAVLEIFPISSDVAPLDKPDSKVRDVDGRHHIYELKTIYTDHGNISFYAHQTLSVRSALIRIFNNYRPRRGV